MKNKKKNVFFEKSLKERYEYKVDEITDIIRSNGVLFDSCNILDDYAWDIEHGEITWLSKHAYDEISIAYANCIKYLKDDYDGKKKDELIDDLTKFFDKVIKLIESKKSNKKSLEESYKSEIDVMYDYEKIFKKKGWTVKRIPDKERTLSAMNILISKNVGDGQLCFYIYCNWGIDYYGDYYSCQINDSSDVEYDYGVVNYRGFEFSGRGFLLFERNITKFCDYLEGTLKELANLKVEVTESKKSARKSIKESKVDFQSVIDKVLPKEYAKNKNAYKYALSCVESLYNEDEYDSDSAKVYFLNCYISDLFPSWVDEVGEEEMDALANGLYDGLMKWKDIDSSWLESKKSIKESKASLHEDNVEYGVERIRNKVKGAKVIYNFDDEDCFIDVTEKNGNLWAFTIDFGSGYVYMLEPKEDRGSFGTDNEAFDVIISMFQGTRFND